MAALPELTPIKVLPEDSRFYVVLSGLIPLVEHPGGLRAYMLDMDGHDHLAGQWLVEKRVPKRLAVELKGLRSGDASLVEDNPAPIVNLNDRPLPSRDDRGVYAHFDLPKPRKFHYLHACRFTFLHQQDDLVNEPTHMAGTRVLEYELETSFEDVRLVESESRWWWENGSRRTRFSNGSEVGTLHLLDGPFLDQDVSPDHNQQEYRFNLEVLGAKNVVVGNEINPTAGPIILPPGLAHWETLPLIWRGALGDALQDVLRTGSVQLAKTINGGCDCCCAPCDGKTRP